ncbi:hypothetical protein F4780DRAFT_781967 [Xylariomycetidae sp. FL0641]|nr:hypothetical protein F4780DRAFT_781967 [Xylariomycetidae sp. FL0641]
MCHGHPHVHPCSHTSVKWLYCPEAIFDLDTGYETACSNPIYSTPQHSNVECPLQNCNYKALKGSWTCCRCGQGPNTKGWCTVTRVGVGYNPVTERPETSSRSSSPEMSFSDVRKGKTSRKSHHSSRSSGHKRGSTYDFGGNFSPVIEEEEATYSSPAPTSSRGSHKHSREGSTEPSKKGKTSSNRKKSHRSRG